MAFTLSSSAAAISKAGAGENLLKLDNSVVDAILADFSNQAEAVIQGEMRIDLLSGAAYTGLSEHLRKFIDTAVTDLIAMDIVSYDTSNYFTARAAETILDKLDNSYRRAIGSLKNQDTKRFLGTT